MKKTPKIKTLFFGTPEFAVPSLQTLHAMQAIEVRAVYTQPDKPVGRSQTITSPPIKKVAQTLGLSVQQPTSLKSDAVYKQIKDYAPDVIIVVAYGKIIPAKLLTIPRCGWVNVHASLLPRYRGAAPIQAAILHGDDTTGVTIMQLDPGLDTGPIIAQQSVSISTTDTAETLHNTLSRLGAETLRETLLPYCAGSLKPHPQDNSAASITKPIRKDDGKIDWRKPAADIERQIRAYVPWPGVYTFWGDDRVVIHRAHIPTDPVTLPPGTVQHRGDMLLVGTGSQALAIDEIQLAGKRKQSALEALRGYPTLQSGHLR